MASTLVVPLADDFHVHLRQGAMMHHVTPMVRQGGAALAYVMVRSARAAPQRSP